VTLLRVVVSPEVDEVRKPPFGFFYTAFEQV